MTLADHVAVENHGSIVILLSPGLNRLSWQTLCGRD